MRINCSCGKVLSSISADSGFLGRFYTFEDKDVEDCIDNLDQKCFYLDIWRCPDCFSVCVSSKNENELTRFKLDEKFTTEESIQMLRRLK